MFVFQFIVNGPAPNAPGGSPRPLNHLKQHLLHKGAYGSQSPTSPQSFAVNGPPSMHQPMGPPQMQAPTRMQVNECIHFIKKNSFR